jgi:hypothetical protein
MVLFACGGEVTPDSERSERSAGDAQGASGGDQGGGLPTDQLPACQEGFERSSAGTPCPWLGEGLCYSTKEAACACVCPRGRSICSSGFPSETLPTEVFCS